MWLFKRPPKVRGAIAYYGLTDWWLETFTPQERQLITTRYRPMGSGPEHLTRGHVDYNPKTSGVLLHQAAMPFTSPEDFSIARRLLEKAEQECLAQDDTVGLHYTYSWMGKTYFGVRHDVPEALALAIEACEKEIAMAPQVARAFRSSPGRTLPSHGGYKHLALIREEQGDFREAIRLYKEVRQKGWSGDWGDHIARCERKLREQNNA